MSSLLRQSRNLARLSKSSLQCTTRSTLRKSNHSPLLSSRLTIQQTRSYANSPKQKNPNGVKNDSEVKKAVELPSKSAPGTENLYDGNAPLSKKAEAGESTESGEPPLAEGMTKL